ncbi:MAG TPA: hypothetical protein VKM55_09150, partial [Candidatus Lokiarchaeia archaeon]|nr:hypothetical protein [Candidatus Lokiarchaeia archaeon]
YTGSGGYHAYTAPFALASAVNGTITINYYSTDHVGNVETAGTLVVRLDTIAPTSTLSFIPHYDSNYVNLTTAFTITANDNLGGSGVGTIYYKTDIVTWTAYSVPFNLNGYSNGTYTISYYSVDRAGNIETTHQQIVNLAIIGPTIVITSPANQTYGTSTITVVLSHTNDIAYQASWFKIMYVGNNSVLVSNKTWTSPTAETLTNGIFRIRAWGNDTYGNVKQASDVIFTIDTTAPQVQLLLPANITYRNPSLLVVVKNDSATTNVQYQYYNGITWSGNATLAYNGTRWISTPISLPDGHYQIRVYAKNLAHPSIVNQWFTIDTTPPTTSIAYNYAWAPNYVNQTTIFTLTANDGAVGSGVASTQYQYTGSGGYHTYTAPFALSLATNGTITINYYSTDNAGNVETPGTLIIRLDTLAPTTTISYAAAWAPNFVTTSTIFTLAGSDNAGGSGLATRFYNINGSGWVAGNSFNLGGWTNGTITIAFRSTDHVGNTEVFGTKIVRLDTIAPTTGISYTAAWAPSFVNLTTQFTLSPADNNGGSGFASTQYQYTGSGGYHAYSVPFTLSSATNGTITINYYSTDHVGNVETAGTLVVRLDTIAPSTTILYTPAWTPNFVTTTTTFSLAGSDNAGGSGLSTRFYNINGSGWVAGNSFNLGGWTNGTITINYYGTDHVGNVEIAGTLVVRLDTLAPTTGISYTAAWAPNFVNLTTQFTLTPADNNGGSGIASTAYQYTGSGGYTTYSGPFTLALATTGNITINYYSIDHVGNVEATGMLVVRLDPVVTTLHYTPAHLPNMVNNGTQFSLVATGIFNQAMKNTTYRINGSAWHVYTHPFNLTGNASGQYLIEFHSTDIYNNVEAIKNVTVMLLANAPRVLGSILLSPASANVGQIIKIRVTCDSSGYNASVSITLQSPGASMIGVQQANAMANLGNGTYEYTWVTSGLEPGNYTITIYVSDIVDDTVHVETTMTLTKGGGSNFNLVILILGLLVSILAIVAIVDLRSSKTKKLKKAKLKQPKAAKATGLSKKKIEQRSYVPAEELTEDESSVKVPSEELTKDESSVQDAETTWDISKQAAPEENAEMTADINKTAPEELNLALPEKLPAEKPVISVVEQALIALFKKHDNFIPSKTDIYTGMKEVGFTMFQIELAFDNLRRASDLEYSAKQPKGWHYKKSETMD